MSAPTFAHPWYLAPFGALALLALAAGLWAQARPGVGVRVVGQRPWALGAGLAFVLAGLGLGVAEPRWGLPEVPRLTVHVVLDTSRSMIVDDVQGKTRWDAALARLGRLWESPRPGVRYGLDFLSGDLVPMVPPGEDRVLLLDALRAAAPGEVGSPGSAFGRGFDQVAAQAEPGAPAVVLLLTDGEETLEEASVAQARVAAALKKAQLPLYAVVLGGPEPRAVPGVTGLKEPPLSRARPDFLKPLAEGSGGRLLEPGEELGALVEDLTAGRRPLPVSRSLQPAHPEWGAWLALPGLLLWLAFAGQPLRRWRPVILLLLALAPLRLQAAPDLLPRSAKAWMAQRALERDDLAAAQAWRQQLGPVPERPGDALLAARIDLASGLPDEAVKALAPLLGPGAPQPLPPWRAPALLLAARAQVRLGNLKGARELLERLLRENPGQKNAVHDLQTFVKDSEPPPPPNPESPPPPPRPSFGAQQDELEGMKQRMPKPPADAKGVKDY